MIGVCFDHKKTIGILPLASFEPRVFFVDDVHAAFAANYAAIAVADFKGFKGIHNFHDRFPAFFKNSVGGH